MGQKLKVTTIGPILLEKNNINVETNGIIVDAKLVQDKNPGNKLWIWVLEDLEETITRKITVCPNDTEINVPDNHSWNLIKIDSGHSIFEITER